MNNNKNIKYIVENIFYWYIFGLWNFLKIVSYENIYN